MVVGSSGGDRVVVHLFMSTGGGGVGGGGVGCWWCEW